MANIVSISTLLLKVLPEDASLHISIASSGQFPSSETLLNIFAKL